MNGETRDLDVIQRWMQAVITHPLGIEAGVASAAAMEELDVDGERLETVITRSKALNSVDRLAVYGNAYYARLLECMRESFPALLSALGEELFDAFSLGYLEQHPSRSYTLGKLTDRFIDFLEETRPELDELGEDDSEDAAAEDASDGALEEISDEAAAAWPDFIIDLARLEWTIDQVFDGPGFEHETPLTAEQIASISAEQWPDARLEPVVCLRLLSFRYPVNDYYTAYRAGEDAPIPSPAESFVAISRRDFVVRRFPLSKPQFQLLSSLVNGCTVGEAIARCADSMSDLDSLATSLQNWFRIWSANQFFRSISPGEAGAS